MKSKSNTSGWIVDEGAPTVLSAAPMPPVSTGGNAPPVSRKRDPRHLWTLVYRKCVAGRVWWHFIRRDLQRGRIERWSGPYDDPGACRSSAGFHRGRELATRRSGEDGNWVRPRPYKPAYPVRTSAAMLSEMRTADSRTQSGRDAHSAPSPAAPNVRAGARSSAGFRRERAHGMQNCGGSRECAYP